MTPSLLTVLLEATAMPSTSKRLDTMLGGFVGPSATTGCDSQRLMVFPGLLSPQLALGHGY